MKRSLHTERDTPRGGVSPALQASRPANDTGSRLAFAVGLIAALALGDPASSFAQRAATRAIADEEVAAPSDTVMADSLNSAPAAPRPPAVSSEPTPSAHPAVPAVVSDDLPFAENEVPETYPSFGVAFSVGGYLSNFATVERAFNAIEDAYRADGGFFVPRAKDVALGPIVLQTFKVRFNRRLDVGLQVGRAGTGSDDQLSLMAVLVSGRQALSKAGKVSLFAGMGAGTYGFTFKRKYGAQIVTSPSGGYYRLDSITLEGGGRYWTTAGGLTIRAWPLTVEVGAQYLGAGDVSTGATHAGDVRLNLSGTVVGVSITGFF